MSKKSEHLIQCEIVTHFRLNHPHLIIFAIPNGGKRGKRTAYSLKQEGVMAGVPDLFIARSMAGYGGLFLEVKTNVGRLSDSQKIVIPKLIVNGFKVEVVRSLEQSIKVIDNYLSLEG